MYELIRVGERTYYMDRPTKVGFYKTGESDVVLIDAGSDKDAAKKVKRILEEQHWQLKAIFNTHSHADHIGGNAYLQEVCGCRIYAPGMELANALFPLLEPTILYGGKPLTELHNKFLVAKESKTELLTAAVLPQGLTMIPLPGHSYEMVGFATDDGVVFLADCLSSEETLAKYQVGVVFDVAAYLETLETVKQMRAKMFVPAHAPACSDIAPLAQINEDQTRRIIATVERLLAEPKTLDDLIADVFDAYQLRMNLSQRLLVGNTVKSYLTYLYEQERAVYAFENNRMIWMKK